jgi:peptide/nickel transport system substrate-binding protein
MSTSHTTRQSRGRLGQSVAAAGLLLLVTSCSVANSPAPDGQNGSGGEAADKVRIVLQQEPPSLEPCDATLTATGVVLRSTITEPLVELNPVSGELEPLLATAWEATGEKEWTFTLRDDVKFHDGTPFNAEAAAFSINRAVNGDLACDVEGAMFGDSDVKVEAVDATKLRITTEAPDPLLPLRVSFVEVVPASTDTTKQVRQTPGTGPYSVKQWDAGQKLTLERNEAYWGTKPAYKTAEYQWRSEGSVRAAMITSGEADIALALGPDDNVGKLGISYPNNETAALRIADDVAPLNDIRVRRAMNYAIDKNGIVAGLFPDLADPAAQLVPPSAVGFNEDLKPWEFNMDKAKALVAEAKNDGVDVGAKITFVARTAQFPKIEELVQILQQQLTEAGLNVEIKMTDTSTHLQYQMRPFVENEGAIAVLVQHGNQGGDAWFTVEQYMKTGALQSYIGDAGLDKLLQTASESSGDARDAAYEDVLKYQNDEVVAYASIAHLKAILGKSAQVNYEPNAATADELRIADITPAG